MRIAFELLAVVCIVFTLLPFLRYEHWLIRMFDFPRLQILVLAAVAVTGMLAYSPALTTVQWVIMCTTVIAIIFQSIRVLPYTVVGKKRTFDGSPGNGRSAVSIMSANVLMTNTAHEKLVALVKREDPDMVLTLETDEYWEKSLSILEKDRPYTLKCPKDNLYGMHLYSRLPLHDAEIRYLIEDDVPSVRAVVELPSGDRFTFYGLHPRPPAPQENETSLERDAELIVVAKEVEQLNGAVIVAGDLNDVAWSHTSRLFQRISGLLDPRMGRGFFNTFPAQYMLLRCPLDHVFHSADLQLLKLHRTGPIGSDHFPIHIQLVLTPEKNNGNSPPAPDAEDRKEADRKVANGTS